MLSFNLVSTRGQNGDLAVPLAVQNIRLAVALEQAALAAAGTNNMQAMNDGKWPFPSGTPGPGGSGEDWTNSPPPPNYTTSTNLWIQLLWPTNAEPSLILHNTSNGVPYEILGSPKANAPRTNWTCWGIWTGSPGTNTTIPISLGTNADYFFDACTWSFGSFPDEGAGAGQILLVLASNSPVVAMLNGVSNTIARFSSNYALVDPPIYSLNLGYDASDSGPTNSTTYTNWAPLGIQGLYGFSDTITNLLLSYNPLTNLDVHGFPALQDLECWHCANLLAINLTNCPALERICLESCNLAGTLNLSGDTNLEELRAASQGSLGTGDSLLHNLVFGGAGPHIWHLCAHDNAFTTNFDFSQFPSLKEFWFWQAGQSGSLSFSSTNLTSVQVYNDAQSSPANQFTSVDLHGQLNLTNLEIESIAPLTNINVSGCSNLTDLDARWDDLPTSVIDSVLTNLDAFGRQPGTVSLYGINNQWPSSAGLVAATNLNHKGWDVEYNGTPSGIPQIANLQAMPASNTAIIEWTTQIPSDSKVYYGLTTNYGSMAIGNSNTTHSASLSYLTTNTIYHYYVTSTSGTNTGSSGDNQFLTLGAPPYTNAIYFVSTSPSITMVAAIGNSTVTWYWGDRGIDTVSIPTHTFIPPGTYTNRVVVSSVTSLTAFGVGCQTNSWTNTLTSVWGLTNYPGLQDLFFYQAQLSQLSLAECSNLIHLALVGCIPSSTIEDQWFIDLNNAESSLPPEPATTLCDGPSGLSVFYYPVSGCPGPTTNSLPARNSLQSKGWTLLGY